jgi:hypothetical protein
MLWLNETKTYKSAITFIPSRARSCFLVTKMKSMDAESAQNVTDFKTLLHLTN